MSTNSTIEWTATVHPDGSVTPGSTWNPVRGCTKVSAGCKFCYAETFAERFRGVKGHPYEQGFDLRLVPEKLTEPLTWKKPRRVFVNSMSDLFQDGVPFEFIDQAFAVMAITPAHTYQVLTKRADRMLEYFKRSTIWNALHHYVGPTISTHDKVEKWCKENGVRRAERERRIGVINNLGGFTLKWPLPNVWLGVSVENQHFADERIPLLLQTPAAIRFISAEPLLGSVNLKPFMPKPMYYCPRCCREKMRDSCHCGTFDNQPTNQIIGLDWVIVGGESGPKARPFDLAWARSIVKQCADAGVACFVKQLGANARVDESGPQSSGYRPLKFSSKKGGDPSEWPADLQVRHFPQMPQ